MVRIPKDGDPRVTWVELKIQGMTPGIVRAGNGVWVGEAVEKGNMVGF